MICGILLAGAWMLANGWAIAGVCRCVLRSGSPPHWRVLVLPLAVKFPLLYGLGSAAVVWLRPSAIGLAIGVTLGLAVLVAGYARTVQVEHG